MGASCSGTDENSAHVCKYRSEKIALTQRKQVTYSRRFLSYATGPDAHHGSHRFVPSCTGCSATKDLKARLTFADTCSAKPQRQRDEVLGELDEFWSRALEFARFACMETLKSLEDGLFGNEASNAPETHSSARIGGKVPS